MFSWNGWEIAQPLLLQGVNKRVEIYKALNKDEWIVGDGPVLFCEPIQSEGIFY